MLAAIATFLGAILAPLLSAFVRANVGTKSAAVKEGEAEGSFSTVAAAQTQELKDVKKASDAGDAVDRRISGDSGLRKYEASDPNNRD